ncbi:PLP-dependent lyase/thiolase [Patescibacteria group bacterium]
MTEIHSKERHKKSDIFVVKELPFPSTLNPKLVQNWAKGIPLLSENDPDHPEWNATPTHEVQYKGRKILVKDESANPTGTMKDRPAWEMACLYRDLARACLLKGLSESEIRQMSVPSLSIITSGNAGRAVAEVFKKYDLPPPRILIGEGTNEAIITELEKLYANIYRAELKSELSGKEILRLTNNTEGKDITSDQTIEPQAVFYDWLAHEVFNQLDPNPEAQKHIYMPYGSGRLFESLLYWQVQSIKRHLQGLSPDPRLKIDPMLLLRTSLHGAEPEQLDSKADKLTAPHKPFLIYQREEVKTCTPFQLTGDKTGVENFDEKHLEEAHRLFKEKGIKAEKSGAAGMALAIQDIEEGRIGEEDQIIDINTGKGLLEKRII